MKNTQASSNGNKALIVIWVAGIIGFLDALYLTLIKLTNTPLYCTPGLGDCDVVNTSKWSELWGIPIALFGATTFAAVILVLIFSNKNEWFRKHQNLILFAISFTGFLYSVYLTYLELFVIRAICQWCVLSALSITVILIATIVRLNFKELLFSNQGGD